MCGLLFSSGFVICDFSLQEPFSLPPFSILLIIICLCLFLFMVMDNSSQCPQGFGVVKSVDNPSPSGSIDQQRKRTLARPQKDQIVNCPRCNSVNTKFCYYNNYSLSQPRYFCKTCRRYWTAGGSLRNVPVGGGSRKNRRSSSSVAPSSVLIAAVHAQAQEQVAVANTLHEGGHDLNLSFPPHPTTTHDDRHRHHHYPNPTFTTTTTKPNFSIDHLSNSKLLPHHHQLRNPSSTNMTPLLPPMGLFNNTFLAHDHSCREMMSSLMNPPEHHNANNSNNVSIFSSAGFPTIHQDQFKPSSLNFSLDGFNSDHDGYVASSLQLGFQQQNSDGNAGGPRLLLPFNQQDNLNNKEYQKQVPSASAASSSDVVQFDHQHNINRSSSTSVQGGTGGDFNGASAGFWTGMLSGGSW